MQTTTFLLRNGNFWRNEYMQCDHYGATVHRETHSLPQKHDETKPLDIHPECSHAGRCHAWIPYVGDCRAYHRKETHICQKYRSAKGTFQESQTHHTHHEPLERQTKMWMGQDS